ncbi:MAG: chemotaxis protein CheA [Gammaproteobacteria bacterium SHHR-1]|uniref:chemotaxis protein CheA n=1 Tax=Magnetovirga frankeli TaxID=947516 RepID=UPI0012934643|nr:chemotaxis protein CheA [gamma proteobacterium SS-5]
MSNDDAKLTFAQEANELLQEMEDALLSLEEAPDDSELLNSVFRSMHTIKGAAGVFGYDCIVEFTHPIETEMDRVRNGERQIDSDMIAVLLESRDHCINLVEHVLHGDEEALSEELIQRGEELLNRITGGANASKGSAMTPVNEDSRLEKDERGESSNDFWMISLEFGPDALRNGLDPMSFLRYLKTLGEIDSIVSFLHHLPAAEEMDPESCYLGFRIAFNSDADKKSIESVFEFARDDCDIRILSPSSKLEHYMELLNSLPETELNRLGEILVDIGAVTETEISRALGDQGQFVAGEEEETSEPRPLGEILVERKVVDKAVVEGALKKQEKTREKVAQEAKYIRVDADKLGHLINLVGELVISSAAMKLQVDIGGHNEMEEVVSGVEHLVEEIRDNALQLRMVQIGDTFSRFRRVVRDVSKNLGKEIDLVITGGDTELDKTVVEKINDPLTHLIRNSLDHGIELPEVRQAKGKPATGTVHLNAFHDSGHIVIQIKDDGAGLDTERLRAKAEAMGKIQPEQGMSKQDLLRLIFEPGLSTKQEASDLSGRGVGMDVVKRNIESLRGTVEVDSEIGEGTTITIHLPLTLAIIDGFMVGAGKENYIIPLSMVGECVEMDEGGWQLNEDRRYVNLRGEVLPYLRLRNYFSVPAAGEEEQTSGHESLVVVRSGRSKAGFVVDELYGELQTVIKPLGKVFERLQGISGATVLGTGEVALILDVQELITQASA